MKLTEKHKAVIDLLIEGNKTVEEIADSVNVSRRTVYNWQEDETFKAEYREALKSAKHNKNARLRSKALNRMEGILDNGGDKVAASVARDVLRRTSEADDGETGKPVVILNNIPDPESIRNDAVALLLSLDLDPVTKKRVMDALERQT